MIRWDREFEKRLLLARNYRQFAAAFFQSERQVGLPRPLSFSAFALRAGFSSKAFMHEVLSGRKRIGPGSFDRVCKGLRLKAGWADYFRCLVAMEESKFHSPGKEKSYFQKKAVSLKKKLTRLQDAQSVPAASRLAQIYLQRDFPEVYAALGTKESGAEIGIISRRSAVPVPRVESILREMKAAGMVSEIPETGRFLPLAQAVDLDELGSTEVIRADIFRSLDKARARAAQSRLLDDVLFMTQTFSVRSQHLPRLRQEIAEIVRSFASEAEEAEGDTVADLVLGFTSAAQK